MGIGCRRGGEAVNAIHRRRAIFLDRDGVLIETAVRNRRPYAVTAPQDVRIIDGVTEACRELSRLGFLLVLVTNQPDVARGKISRAFVDETNMALAETIGLDDVEVCDHDDVDDCDCRKPRPGLLMRAAEKLSVDLGSSILVGDRWRDVEAGRNAGCKTVFIDCGYDEKMPEAPDHIAKSLPEAIGWIRSQI